MNAHWNNVRAGRLPPTYSPFVRVLNETGPFDNTEIITGIRAIQFISDRWTQAAGAGVDFEVVDIIKSPNSIPIRSLSYHNYIKTAHTYKKYAPKSLDQKCCTSNGKLVKKVKQLTYKRSPETCSSSHVRTQKLNTLSCVKNDRKECSLPTKLMCLDDRPINRGRNACSKSINKISQGSLTNFKKVKTYRFVSASDHINSVNTEEKKQMEQNMNQI